MASKVEQQHNHQVPLYCTMVIQFVIKTVDVVPDLGRTKGAGVRTGLGEAITTGTCTCCSGIEVPCASHPTERPSKRRTTMRPRSAMHNTLDRTATASTTRKRVAHPTHTGRPVGSPPTPIIVGTQTRTSPADSKQERANSPAPFLVFCMVLDYADGDFRKFNK